MTDTALSDLLRQLHRTLHGTGAISEQDRELLQQLSADIGALLEAQRAPAAAGHQPVIDRLQSAITRFEVSHPDLTATMALASKRLSDMGI